MTKSGIPTGSFDALDGIIAKYLESLEAGQSPSRESVLAQHPEQAERLRAFFRDFDAVGRDASKFRLPPSNRTSETVTHDKRSPVQLPKIQYLGDYELQSEIARGGMGVVYRARQVSLNRPVAVKMILAGTYATLEAVQRFRAEAEAAANLDHPNILPIYEVGEHDGHQYFSMKLVEGGSLSNKIEDLKTNPKQIVELMATLARAVHFAHQRGILHRDLKPANVLMDADGTPYVTDFGLAKKVDADDGSTRTGSIVGTPSYMAPEQARGEKGLTTSVDVYSLGAILYEMLTGQPPFKGETIFETVKQVMEMEPKDPRTIRPSTDRDLSVIALKCLSKAGTSRYTTAGDLAEDLERFSRGEPILAREIGRFERGAKWVRRNKAVAALSLFGILSLLVGCIVSVIFALGQLEARRATDAEAEKVRQQKERADANALESRRRLARQYVSNGTRRLDQDDLAGSLVWYTEALALEEDDAEQSELHRRRIGCLLRDHPRLVRSWLLPDGVRSSAGPIISFDGKTILSTANEQIQLFDLDGNPKLKSPLTLSIGFRWAHFSHNDRYILGANQKDGRSVYRLWQAADGQPVGPELIVKGFLSNNWPLIDPEGKWVFFGRTVIDENGLPQPDALLWDPVSGQTRKLDLPIGFFLSELSPDGKRAIAIRANPGEERPGWTSDFYPDAEVVLVDTQTWKTIGPTHQLARDGKGPEVYATFATDGRLLLGDLGRNELRICDADGKRCETPLAVPNFNGLVAMPRAEICLWRSDGLSFLPTTNPQSVRSVTIRQPFSSVVPSFDGKRLAIWQLGEPGFRIFDVEGNPLSPLISVRNGLNQPGFVQNDTRFSYIDGDRLVRVYDFARPRTLRQMDGTTFLGTRYLEQNPSMPGHFALIDSDGFRLLNIIKANPTDSASTVEQQISPDGTHRYTITDDGTVTIDDLLDKTQKIVQTSFKKDLDAEKRERFERIIWWANNDSLVLREVISDRFRIQRIDVRSGELGPMIERPLKNQGPLIHHESRPGTGADGKIVLWTSDDDNTHHTVWLATGEPFLPPMKTFPGDDRPHTLTVWHIDSHGAILRVDGVSEFYVDWSPQHGPRRIDLGGIRLESASAVANEDGSRLALYSGPELLLIDRPAARLLSRIGLPKTVLQIEFHPKTGAMIVLTYPRRQDERTGGALLRIWDATTGKPRTGFLDAGKAHGFGLSRDGSLVNAGGQVWDTRSGAPINSRYAHLPETGQYRLTSESLNIRVELTPSGYRVGPFGVEFFSEQPTVSLLEYPITQDRRTIDELRRIARSLACRGFDDTEGLSLLSEADIASYGVANSTPLTDEARKQWYSQELMDVGTNGTYIRFLLERLLELDPKNWRWHYDLANLDRRDKRFAESLAGYNRALKAAEDEVDIVQCLTVRGCLHYEKRDWTAAEADFNEAIRHAPTDSSARGARGLVRLWQGRYAEALPDLESLRKTDIFSETLVVYAQALAGDLPAFQSECDRLVKPLLERQNSNYVEDKERAVLWMLATDPGPSPHLKKVAEWFATRYNSTAPYDSDKLFLGVVAYREGRFADALKLLESLSQATDDPYPEKYPFLVMTYHRLGEVEKARRAMEAFQAQEHIWAKKPNPFDTIKLAWLRREVELVLKTPREKQP